MSRLLPARSSSPLDTSSSRRSLPGPISRTKFSSRPAPLSISARCQQKHYCQCGSTGTLKIVINFCIALLSPLARKRHLYKMGTPPPTVTLVRTAEITMHLGEAASASSFFAIAQAEADDEVRRQNRQLAEFRTSSDGHRYSRSSHTHPNDVQYPNDPEDGDYPELPKYNEERMKMTDLMLEKYPRKVVLDSWRPIRR
ncbi:hypothetical protein MVLG_05711 [Microbotryum lychnidis-dioicae p1A1 Lamole]|uniref:Uncharacterized protein n=1 Tax=Microbotryum lychnidis-dioicae (strain p1A1 Lamole / MvSl-1064) TaxID=683840 RepID=U5HF24_USTV1|nr:hypothetical protein MVLG_05711 [Microbotryum lychnidis-dioicae p1A1 Lamole]|eukprot:KDE03827.1 hypothetical protein MVLG_05711 [Microbotryum lychnidis-dioicae p1A1 Lamole]